MDDQTADKREDDRPRGCPVTVRDDPYVMTCGMGAKVGVCATHGRFRRETWADVDAELRG